MPFLPSLTRRTIKRFKIDPGNLNAFFSSVESAPLGENWPVVYLLHNESKAPIKNSFILENRPVHPEG